MPGAAKSVHSVQEPLEKELVSRKLVFFEFETWRKTFKFEQTTRNAQ